jgi:hypothetical protein
LVDERRAFANKPIASSVQRLHIELLLAFQFDKSHGGARGCLGDRFRIPVVVLLRFDVGAHILRRHQPDGVPHRCQLSAEVMGAAACFHSNDAPCQLRGEFDNVFRSYAPPLDYCTVTIESYDAAAVLAQVNSQNRDVHR